MRLLLLIAPAAALAFLMPGPVGNARSDSKASPDNLAARHARVGIRELLNTNGAFVQEMTIETPQPAEVTVTVLDPNGNGSGSVYQTKRRPGQSRASGRLILYLDYLRSGKDNPFVKQAFLKWAMSWGKDDDAVKTGASQNPPLAMPETKSLDDILHHKMQPGEYAYANLNGRGGEGQEFLSVGECRMLLRIGEPRPGR
jgi:hypothetical protein